MKNKIQTADTKRVRLNLGTPILMLGICVVCQIASVTLMKRAAISLKRFGLMQMIENSFYLISLCLLGVQALVWPLVLKRLPLFFVYSAMALSYPGILLASVLIFHESISLMNVIGTSVIVVGVVIFVLEGGRSHA